MSKGCFCSLEPPKSCLPQYRNHIKIIFQIQSLSKNILTYQHRLNSKEICREFGFLEGFWFYKPGMFKCLTARCKMYTMAYQHGIYGNVMGWDATAANVEATHWPISTGLVCLFSILLGWLSGLTFWAALAVCRPRFPKLGVTAWNPAAVLGKAMELWWIMELWKIWKYDERYEIYVCPCMSFFFF